MGTITPHLMERLLSITGTPEDRDALILAIQTGGGDITGEEVAYDNQVSGLAATDVQSAIDEIAAGGGGGGSSVISANLTDDTYTAQNIAGAIIDPTTKDGFDLDYLIKRKYTNANTAGGQIDETATSNQVLSLLDNSVLSVVVDNSGVTTVAGIFTSAGEETVGRIARFNSSGLDTSFTGPGTGANGQITNLYFDYNNTLIATGNFTTFNGVSSPRLAVMDANGNLDTAVSAAIGTGFNGETRCSARDVDGNIIVGGSFTTLNSVTRNRLVMLNSDGTVNTTFATNIGTGPNNTVTAMRLYGTKLYIGGNFTSINGVSINRIACLNLDGTLDATFRTNIGTGFNQQINSLSIDETNGDVLASGQFLLVNGVSRAGLARITAAGVPVTAFNSRITDISSSFSSSVLCNQGVTYFASGSSVKQIDQTGRVNTMFVIESTGGSSNNCISAGGGIIAVGGSMDQVNGITVNNFVNFSGIQTGQDIYIYEKGTGSGYLNDESGNFIYERTNFVGQDSYIPLTINSSGQIQYTAGNVVGDEVENSIKLTIRSL